jgi:multiple sugar transport system permease protein
VIAAGRVAPARPRSLVATILGAESSQGSRRALWGYLFISPWLVGLVGFILGPMVASLYWSFTAYDILSAPHWVGLQNYQYAFYHDDQFWPSLGRSFYYAALVVPLGIIASLALAMLLNQNVRGTNVFRSLFFLPHLTPAVAMAILWLWLLHPQLGPVNQFLKPLGLGGYTWLQDRDTVIPTLVLMAVWSIAGGNGMLIFLAGLQGVPRDLEEAAEIDGAGAWTKFRHVTLPMITPTIFFNLVLGMIGALQVFAVAYVATAGGPSYGSWFYALHVYQHAFQHGRMGYGSTLAWIFLTIVLVLTLINFAFSKKWVFYRGES